MIKYDKNIPTLRFKEFDDSWIIKKLGSLGNTNGGLIYSPKDVVDDSSKGTLVLRSSNVQDGKMTFDNNVYVNCLITDKDLVRENDILLCVRNGSKNLIGKCLIIKKEHVGFAFGAFMAIYRSESNAFIYHFFNTSKFYNQVHEHLGATINQITGKSLNSFKISIPSLPEQQKIASFLSSIDEKINQLKRKKELLEQYKKGVMQQLFSGKLRFKDENGVEYPEWEEKRLIEVGKIITGSTPETSNSGYYGGKQLFVSPADISTSRFVTTTITTLSDLGFDKCRNVQKGSILFVCIGSTIGKIAIAGKECATNQQINSIETTKHFSSDFIYSLLEFNGPRIKLLAGTQAVPQINKSDFSKIKFHFPILKEQQKIANFLFHIDSKIEKVNFQINKTQTFKKGLLQQMFV